MKLQIHLENGESFITDFNGSFDEVVKFQAANLECPGKNGIMSKIIFITEQKTNKRITAKIKTLSYLISEHGEFMEVKGNLFVVSSKDSLDNFYLFIYSIGKGPYLVNELLTGLRAGTCNTNKETALEGTIKQLSVMSWQTALSCVAKNDKQNSLPENLSDFSRAHIYGY